MPGFRTVLDGNFEIDKNNYVTYHVKKSQASDIPQQVKLRGGWSLDKEHNLVLTLDKWGNQIAGNKLTVQSELIDTQDNRLSFALTSKEQIAFAQSYFAIQTRRQELLEERIALVERVHAREKLADTESELSGVAYERGVDGEGFARLRSKGDQALFGGYTTLEKS